jgi:predicted Zn-dependent protease with MMP-like domain
VRLRPLGHRSACLGPENHKQAAHLASGVRLYKRRGLPREPARLTARGMTRAFGTAPTAEEMEALARAALARLPAQFREHLGDVVLLVEDFADEELLAEMGIEDPFELTGVYEGLPLHEKSIGHSGALPDRIRLFRAPILDEWIARGDESLEHLVAHVLVHEVGHHFGLSDETMHALEDQVR